MARYGEMFQFLMGEPAFVATTALNAVLAALFLAIAGTWLPLLVLRGSKSETVADGVVPPRDADLNWFSLFTLSVGGGLVLTVTLGTASAFVFKQLLPGAALAFVIGLAAATLLFVRIRRDRVELGVGSIVLAAITAVPFCLGLWHHVFMAFPQDLPSGPVIVFSDLHRDSGFHVHLASILAETGLPLRDLYGSPTQEYSPVIHTGHGVLLGSIATVLQTSMYRASTALWIVVMVLLSWSAGVLLSRGSVPHAIVLLGSLCPLVLGPLAVPTMATLTQPPFALNQFTQSSLTAPRMYWNLPQALSTAMVAVALVCFDGYCRAEPRSRARLRWVFGSAAAMAASGWVKPSLFVFYGPALLIALLVHRAAIRETAAAIATLAGAVAVYLLPSWLVTVAEHPSWSLHPSVEQTQHVAKFVLLGCGPALLLSFGPLRKLPGLLVRKSDPQPLTPALVAMGGSLLFALLFRENRYEELKDFSVFQPNIWWGPSACVVLLVPLLLRSATQRIVAAGKADWFVIAGVILGAVQVASGTLLAAAYPAVIGRTYSLQDTNLLQAARDKTTPTTRFLIDPILLHQFVGFSDLGGLLARPCLFGTSYMSDSEFQILKSWNEMFQEPFKTEGTGWAEYDAAILSELDGAKAARNALSERGWTSEELGEGFRLWRRPEASSAAVPAPRG